MVGVILQIILHVEKITLFFFCVIKIILEEKFEPFDSYQGRGGEFFYSLRMLLFSPHLPQNTV